MKPDLKPHSNIALVARDDLVTRHPESGGVAMANWACRRHRTGTAAGCGDTATVISALHNPLQLDVEIRALRAYSPAFGLPPGYRAMFAKASVATDGRL